MSEGGTGTPQDPYTFEEYQNLVSSGTWLGGFVAGSTETYTRDESGNFVKSEVNDAIYVEKDCIVLPDLVVDATRKDKKKDQYDDNSGFWGFSDDNDRDSSGTYISDPSDNWISSENLDGGGGGGSSSNYDNDILKNSGIYWENSSYSNLDLFLRESLYELKENSFGLVKSILRRFSIADNFIKATLKIESLTKALGITEYESPSHDIDPLNGRFDISIRIDNSFITKMKTLGNVGKLAVMAVLTHELIHADLYRINYIGTNNTPLTNNFDASVAPTLKEFLNKKNKGEIQDAHHEYIGTYYVASIEKELRNMMPNLPDSDYKVLSWMGLTHTEAFKRANLDHEAIIKRMIQYGLL